MHELSHGSNSSKNRLEFISVSIFTLSAILYMFNLHIPAVSVWIIGMWLAFYTQIKYPKIEPKKENEREMIVKPQYNISEAQLICMLRNAQVAKRGK